MLNLLRLVALAPEVTPSDTDMLVNRLRDASGTLPGIGDVMLARTPSRSAINPADLIWRVRFPDRNTFDHAMGSEAWRSGMEPLFSAGGPFVSAEHVIYCGGRSGGRERSSGLYRVALFCANQSATPERIRRWSDELAEMPRHVPAIRWWGLTEPSETRGTRPWTVVWEQEFDDVRGLNGPYAMHPYHWAQVDRWFDPEYPEFLVDSHLCHSFGEFHRRNTASFRR